MSLDPGVIAFLVAIGALYVRAVRVLRGRGYRVPVAQQVWWWVGVALQTVALVGPLDDLSDQLLSAHMAQHLLLADVAVPFLLAGVRTPVLVFFLPRPVLVGLAHRRALRRVFRVLRQPLAALPTYLVILYIWHFGFAFQGALRHPALHALQHVSFVLGGVLIWWAAIEPQRRRLQGELWKIPYIFAARMVSMFLGVAFVVTRTPFYRDIYGSRPHAHGVDALADTQIAGGLMMTLDIVVIGGALIFFFWRASQDADASEAAERTAPAAT